MNKKLKLIKNKPQIINNKISLDKINLKPDNKFLSFYLSDGVEIHDWKSSCYLHS
jgi:hypothetical protein